MKTFQCGFDRKRHHIYVSILVLLTVEGPISVLVLDELRGQGGQKKHGLGRGSMRSSSSNNSSSSSNTNSSSDVVTYTHIHTTTSTCIHSNTPMLFVSPIIRTSAERKMRCELFSAQ